MNTKLPAAPRAVGMRTDYISGLDASRIGATVTVCGWVSRVRSHGEHLIFVDLRDSTGIVQCVLDSRTDLHAEFVVAVRGTVTARPEGTTNTELSTGDIELTDATVTVLAQADPIPFSLDDRATVDESTRLSCRFLDMRRPRMQRNLRTRAVINSAIRASMETQGFVEVETPLLWTPTPEGAREFLVPSRTQPGTFYSLPQSPQIAKQLLMVAGFDRYYQIARCLRDEDLRADRQFEFTQLDLEASFVTQSDILAFVSHTITSIVQAVQPEYQIFIDTITWQDAMERYGSDKPDRRFGCEIVNLTDALKDTQARALQGPRVSAILAPEPQKLTRAKLDGLVERAKSLGAKGLAWFRVGESSTLSGPVAKLLSDDEQRLMIQQLEAKEGDVILALSDNYSTCQTTLGQIRLDLGRHLGDQSVLDFFWVIDFPLFEGRDDAGNLISAHHPFTMPNEDDFSLLDSDPASVRSQSYDLVLNGWELGSGSIRIHRSDIQRKLFSLLGIDEATALSRFGFLLEAFRYGAPPHGGFAFGIDRLCALLVGEENIREVIAFPKTQSGLDPMTHAPKPVDASLLAQLGLQVKDPHGRAVR